MGTMKVTNSLLVVIALTLLWIAYKSNGSVRPDRGYTKIPAKTAIEFRGKDSHILYAQFLGG